MLCANMTGYDSLIIFTIDFLLVPGDLEIVVVNLSGRKKEAKSIIIFFWVISQNIIFHKFSSHKGMLFVSAYLIGLISLIFNVQAIVDMCILN